jgi:MoaA/NifB/PqqE/SkfB family radical SAM enzyme
MDGGKGRRPADRRWGSMDDVRDTLVLVYNMACPLKCDFCCHAVEDYGPIKMKPETAIGWIRQAAEIDSFDRVVFTGGEPFLYHRDLLHIMESVRDCGLEFRIVTAAHWAETEELAREKLVPLVERGLTEISVSSDPSHQQWVPASYAENALRVALELGVTAELASVFWDPDQYAEDTVDVPLGALKVRHLAVPVGRSKDVKISPEQYRVGPDRFFGCGEEDRYDVTIYPEGEVYPCCSGGYNIQAKLTFGNAFKEPLRDIVDRMHGDRYTRLILEVGLAPIYELAKLRFPEVHAKLPELDPHVSLCQVCALVHADSQLMADLAPVLVYADQVFSKMLDMKNEAEAEEHAALTTVRA